MRVCVVVKVKSGASGLSGGVKKEQVGDIGSSSAVIRVHFDKFFMSSLSRKAAVALGEQAIIVAHADL